MSLWVPVLALPLLISVYLACGGLWSLLRVPRLGSIPDVLPDGREWPRLSVVAACRDEAAGVERAVRSLLTQDYPELEVVFVDDRSTDDTGLILDRLAAENEQLTVVHVTDLPPEWLGKPHACQAAAEHATGDWLLFTDGDVVFEPGSLRRSIVFAERHGLGHLVVIPQLEALGLLERAFVATFGLAAMLAFRTWELPRDRTRAFIGVGAFTLVRANDYNRVGGHGVVAYEVAEDMKLGLVLRRSGVPQGAIESDGLVHVRWNAGLRATMGGLVKNSFAGVGYHWPLALLGVAVSLVGALAPLAAVMLTTGPVRVLAAVTLVACMGLQAGAARRAAGGSGVEGLLQPITQTCFAAVLLWSAIKTEAQGGVRWRGTFYPLPLLRARCVRERDWSHHNAVRWPIPPRYR